MRKAFIIIIVLFVVMLTSCISTRSESIAVDSKIYELYGINPSWTVVDLWQIDEYDDLEDHVVFFNNSDYLIDNVETYLIDGIESSQAKDLVFLASVYNLNPGTKKKIILPDNFEINEYRYLVLNFQCSDSSVKFSSIREGHSDLYLFFSGDSKND